MKRIIARPWGRKHRQGWIVWKDELVKFLKDGDAVQLGEITVGAKQLRQLVNLLPCDDAFIRSNGKLEIETIERYMVKGRDGNRKTAFRKPCQSQFFSILNNAWMPANVGRLVVLRPKKYAS